MKNSLFRGILALAYRETVWLRRYIGEYVVLWLVPLFFVFAIIGLPASISGLETTIDRLGKTLGAEISLLDALSLIIALSSVVNLVSGVVADVTQILYFEFRSEETVSTILLTVGIKRYLVVTSITRPVILVVYSTIYVPLSLTILQGLSGLKLYLMLIPLMAISAVCVGFLSTAIAVFMYHYGGVKRPWVVSGLLVPILISGSGVFIPVELTPWYLRLIAQVTPSPYAAETIRLLVLARGFEVYKWFLAVVTVLFTMYSSLTVYASKVSDKKFRTGV